MKRIVSLLVIVSFSMMVCAGCATDPNRKPGAAQVTISAFILALLGGGVGAAVDKKNPWRGGAIGAVAGGLIGYTLAEMQREATLKAAYTGEPQRYQDNDGNYGEARVIGMNPITRCKKVQRNTYNNGKLVDSSTDEICESEKTTNTY